MTFYAFGLNHETAPVAVREVFALSPDAQRALYQSVELSKEAEWLVLSTCNRTEVYVYGTVRDVAVLQEALAEVAGTTWPARQAFFFEDEDAILHVLQMTAGLKSLILGDAQILTQVKDAYRTATDEESVGAVLHRLMHTAFRTAKRVIHETDLNSGSASVTAAALAVSRRYMESAAAEGYKQCRVLVLGAGQMAHLAVHSLQENGEVEVTISNRTVARAQCLAEGTGARVVAWSDRYAALSEADIVLVTSAADEPVLRAAAMPPPRPGRPDTLLIDIAVPRNVEPAVDALPGYCVLDLDRLNDDLLQTEGRRRAAKPRALSICQEALAEYVSWVFHQQALQPAIHAIRDTFERIRIQEIERNYGRFSTLDREELDRLTTSMIQKLLAVPVVRLKSVDPESIDFVRGIKLLRALFSRPDCEDESAADLPSTDASRLLLPSRCPFELPGDEVLPDDPRQALHEALRSPPRKAGGR